MASTPSETIHVLEFGCQAPLKFYEHCKSCPRFGDDCPELALGKEILRGKKKLAYGEATGDDQVPASAFQCQAPLAYFEKTRTNCAHEGKCREEGLLLVLLSGKKSLDCSDRPVISLAERKKAAAEAKAGAPVQAAQAQK